MKPKRKTKWLTIAREGDLITVGNINIRVTKEHSSKANVGLEIEAPASDKITKQEQGTNGHTKLF
jgi:hypothetical protein